MNRSAARVIGVGVLALASARAPGHPGATRDNPAPYDPAATYAEVERAVADRFLDEQMNGVDWSPACEARRERALACTSPAELGVIVNDLLGELGTSHTAFYPVGTRAWAELLDVFLDDHPWDGWPADFVDLPVTYVGIGVVTREIGGRVFVADVYPDAPAAHAGVLVGDELVSVAGERWADAEPWPAPAGEGVVVRTRRDEGAPARELTIAGERTRPDDVFVAAQAASAHTIDAGGVRVGYVRMRNGAGQAYTDLFERQFVDLTLDGADALVLDIRGGWGGLPLDFVSNFDRDVSRFETRGRDEDEWREQPVVWRRPLVVLMDAGSRSGKEVFVHNVRTAGVGTLVGERTGGAVVGGSPFPMPDGSVLYLAVVDVRIDGERIEGVGVAPDIEVPFDLPYAAGADPQLDAAIAEAARLTRRPHATGTPPTP